jgi:hypothetical protein
MRLSPDRSTTSFLTPPHTEAECARRAAPKGETWRWAILHFPCLEPVAPEGHIVVVSDKKHIAEARRRFPELPVWHVRELGLFGDLVDDGHLDEESFAKVTLLKLKMRGWFLGIEGKEATVSGCAAIA